MTTKFRVSPVMTTSIPLRKYDAIACIIFTEQGKCGRRALLVATTSHTAPEDRQARLSDVGCRYISQRRNTSY